MYDIVWDGMGWDGIGWGEMGWDGMGWDRMGWDGMGWDGMGSDGMESGRIGWDGGGVGLSREGLDWPRLFSAGQSVAWRDVRLLGFLYGTVRSVCRNRHPECPYVFVYVCVTASYLSVLGDLCATA